MSAKRAADIITKNIFSKKFDIYFPKRLILPMKLLQIIPFSIYSFLMRYFVKRKLNG